MKNSFIARLMLGLCLGAFAFSGPIGCSTTEGVGEDIEDAGDSLKDAARDAKD